MARVAVCVAGWYLGEDICRQLRALADCDLFLVSHRRDPLQHPWIRETFDRARVYTMPNRGYDWGCYQQFLDVAPWRDYTYLVFLHDDIALKDPAVVDAAVEQLANCTLIGNGRPMDKRDHPRTHAASYAHARVKPPSRAFEHDLVRGSFFATTVEAVERYGRFEVYWDPWRLSVSFGNWSLRASCAKWEAIFGCGSIGYLSDDYRSSRFVDEHERGGEGVALSLEPWRARLIRHISKSSTRVMAIYWRERLRALRAPALAALTLETGLFSGVFGR